MVSSRTFYKIFALFLLVSIAFHIAFLHFYSIIDKIRTNSRKVDAYEREIFEFQRRESLRGPGEPDASRLFRRRPETQHVDCRRVLDGDQNYTQSLGGTNRVPIVPNRHLDMSCASIRRRVNPFPEALKPLKVGVAFARIVYRDYEFLEQQVASAFHPQNVFCFAVDRKSSGDFRRKIHSLVACFDNMHVLPELETFDSAGHNYNLANWKCMRWLLGEQTTLPWSYVFLLQNHDVVTKTVYELERVYELLGGANDVDVGEELGRVDLEMRWDPRSLKLFRNESAFPDALLDAPMKFAKGFSQVSLSRDAADWLVNTVDLTVFVDQWNQSGYGSDEQFLASFQVNAAYGMPGHFTDECLRDGVNTEHVSRMTQWVPYPNRTGWRRCATKTVRHSICLMGIEDLRTMIKFPTLMANKVMPAFDYSVVECVAEVLHNRTFLGQNDEPLDEEYYLGMPHVLYHKHHREPGYRVQCTPNHTTWMNRPYPI